MEKVWFPGIDRLVERMLETCTSCQAAVPVNNRKSLEVSQLPFKPWDKVGVDFCGPFPSGDYLLVVSDEYTRHPEVEIVQSTAGKSTITKF